MSKDNKKIKKTALQMNEESVDLDGIDSDVLKEAKQSLLKDLEKIFENLSK